MRPSHGSRSDSQGWHRKHLATQRMLFEADDSVQSWVLTSVLLCIAGIVGEYFSDCKYTR